MKKPYVISAELDIANAELEQIIQPNKVERFRETLDADLRQVGKNTLWVASEQIQSGLSRLTQATALPIVSLDDRYLSADNRLGISRGVDTQLDDTGYVPRVGYPSIETQLAQLSGLGREVVVTDDVVFSGEMLAWLADRLALRSVKIGGVVCGIAIREGIEKLNAMGIGVEAMQTFEEVEDELCERDFAVVLGSGRRIADLDTNALYFDPEYGRPTTWASIPAGSARDFAARRYRQAAQLLQPDIPLKKVGKFYGLNGDDAAASLENAAVRNQGVNV